MPPNARGYAREYLRSIRMVIVKNKIVKYDRLWPDPAGLLLRTVNTLLNELYLFLIDKFSDKISDAI